MKVIPANELENHIGEEVGVSDWFEVTQERINQFAEATNDHQFIHVDPEIGKGNTLGNNNISWFFNIKLAYLSSS